MVLNARRRAGDCRASYGTRHPSRGPRQFMLTTASPNAIIYQDVIGQLESLLVEDGNNAEDEGDLAVVVLATPAFATWLEHAPFTSKVLETLANQMGCQNNGISPLKVSALLAVVDGLPPSEPPAQSGPQRTEGFAFLRGHQRNIAPGMWEGYSAVRQEPRFIIAGTRDQRASIILSLNLPDVLSDKVRSEEVLEMTVPLANTIFSNGRVSTLLATSWARSSISEPFLKVDQFEKVSQTIVPFPSLKTKVSQQLEAPLRPLTPGRRIASGLGNIVRQLEGADGVPQPASRELEENIDMYLKSRNLGKDAVSIWALIVPSEEVLFKQHAKPESRQRVRERLATLCSDRGVQAALADSTLPKEDWLFWLGQGSSLNRVRKYKEPETPLSALPLCLSFITNPVLGNEIASHVSWACVTSDGTVRHDSPDSHADKGPRTTLLDTKTISGGGGWGIKAGLLSLDPETGLDQSAEAPSDLEAVGSAAAERAPSLGHVAKPGSFIQFLIADRETTTPPAERPARCARREDALLPDGVITVGCLPSTIDDLPHPTTPSPSATAAEAAAPRPTAPCAPTLEAGVFGALSEAGFFLRSTKADGAPVPALLMTKVDVPYARFRVTVCSPSRGSRGLSGERHRESGNSVS
ncbi:MAG: hypothetical protein M1818_007648 [Claussenomyces sp. TS43310]|nr:MAG: hypothetical protein M1818_007648 [Claussenomyces sp. TS43310]